MVVTLLPLLLVVALASDVVVLTTENFERVLGDNEFVLIKFYAPWCGHCKNMAADYEQSATALKEANVPVVLAKCDATVEDSLAARYKVSGYPSLKFFLNGQFLLDYDGGRQAEEITKWVTKKTGPPSKSLTSEEVESFLASTTEPRAVAFLTEEQLKEWNSFGVSKIASPFILGHVVGEGYEGTVDLYKDGEKISHKGIDVSSLNQFFLTEGFPLVATLSQEVWDRAKENSQDVLTVFRSIPDTNMDATLLEIAKPLKGELVVAVSNLLGIAGRWGASGSVFPTAIYYHQTEKPYFTVWDEDSGLTLDDENLKAFVKGCRDGTYISWQKSEPIPEDNSGPVTVVVAKTFNEIVRQEKNVFIEFYAPWCGHCKQLAPTFDELGEYFENDDSVIIAKMDATANALPKDISIEGYPTLILFTPSNEQVFYNGDHELDSLITWLQAHGVSSTTPEKQDL